MTDQISDIIASARGAFLDRDGVINRDTGYTHRIEDLVFIPGAIRAIGRLNQAGYAVIVVTNQSGVARGYFTPGAVEDFHAAIQARLNEDGAHIDGFFYCLYHPDASLPQYRRHHPDRKPAPGMLNKAIAQFDLDRARSFLIGDRQTDIEAARRAGIAGYLFDGADLDAFLRALDVVRQQG
ncbi:MAG: HAD family hydrolase [Acetobacteraceae bacterium]